MREGVEQGLLLAAVYILGLVAFPIAAIWRAPPQLLQALSRLEIDPIAFAKTLSSLGIILAALAVVESLSDRGSLEWLLASSASTLTGLVLAVYVVSAGQIWSLGNPTAHVATDGTSVSVTLRLRTIVLLLALGACLRIAGKVAEYREGVLPPVIAREEPRARRES
ncbi:MAG: hypothetical protein QI223_07645 [Candidatus Korarchaeota archaeon]|nr:hypothetical protein [Candidatus Korarchaeota archaeon]